jgi:glycosyltransferase involved in cell wall biosynthesis
MAIGLTVIIPVYNEERTLKTIVKKVLKRKEVSEVIIVDDGSRDNSFNVAKSIKDKRVKSYRHRINRGKGSAIRTGIQKSTQELVIIQDADLELNPSNYPKLLRPLKNHDVDFVIGNRWQNNNGFFFPKLGGRILTGFVNLIFSSNFKDSYCGYKVARLSTWRKLKLKSSRFEIEAEIVAKVAKQKLRVGQVDIDYSPRTYKQGKKIKAQDVYKGIITLLRIRFS